MPADRPIIDYGSTPPTSELSPDRSRRAHLENYRRVYRASETAAALQPEAALEAYLATYDQVGARAVVIKAKDVETTFGLRITNEDVAAFCKKHGERFIGFAGVDPNKGMTAVRELEYAVKELGLRGLNIQGFENKVAIDDPKMYPLYAACIQLDIPINIHASTNFSTSVTMDYGRPGRLDAVLTHFPELRAVAAPPGWPWVHELIAVAWRHPNLTIGIAAVRPKYLAQPGSGYEGLLQYGDSVLQDRIVFATSWPMQPIKRAIDEVDALPIKDETKRKWLHDNAARLLGLN